MISDNLIRGGKERRLVELIKGLLKTNKVIIELILLNDINEYPEINSLGIKIHGLKRKIKKDPRIFFRLFRISKKFRPSIIHSWGSIPSLYALPVAGLLKIKLINGMISNANCKILSANWIRAKITFPFSDIIIGNSFAGIRAFNAPESKSIVIHNGFDFNRINNLKPRNSIINALNIKSKYVVGMVAAFHERKDYETYFNVAQKICRTRQDITFLAIGDGEYLDRYKARLDQETNKNIMLTGRQESIESIISIMDIGVLLTNDKVHQEGISNAIVEYMALGKPVIASTGGGTKEIVMHNITGYMIDSGDESELEKKIIYLLGNKNVADAMGLKGREIISEQFDIKNMTNKYLEIYNKVIS